jgi:hypothetical protein
MLTSGSAHKVPAHLIGLAVVSISTSTLAASTREAAGASTDSMGFVVTYIATPRAWELMKTDADCPDGYTASISEHYAALSGSEFIAALVAKHPQVSSTLPSAAYRNGGRESRQAGAAGARRELPALVSKPWLFEEAPAKYVQDGVTRGMNLDGIDAPQTPGNEHVRAHKKMKDPAGGYIDNEMYRALGCYHGFRGKDRYNFGPQEDQPSNQRSNGVTTTLIEIRGIDDRLNDSEVQVGVHASADPVVLDTTRPGKFVAQHARGLEYVSYTIRGHSPYSQVLKGRIVNGILTTEPAQIRIESAFYDPVPDQAFLFRGGRIRIDLKDTHPVGLLAGYFDVTHAYNMWMMAAGTLGAAHGLSGPSIYEALRELADGYPDANGQFTSISSAFDMELSPAFIFPPEEAKKPLDDAKRKERS